MYRFVLCKPPMMFDVLKPPNDEGLWRLDFLEWRLEAQDLRISFFLLWADDHLECFFIQKRLFRLHYASLFGVRPLAILHSAVGIFPTLLLVLVVKTLRKKGRHQKYMLHQQPSQSLLNHFSKHTNQILQQKWQGTNPKDPKVKPICSKQTN